MTAAEALAAIEVMNAERDSAADAARAAVTPHVRRPASAATRAAQRAAYGRYGTNYSRRTWPAATYCGAPITGVDWERREARSAKSAAAAAERGVCPACLAAARD